MTVLNTLILGEPCTVTTSEVWVVNGTFLGIEVAFDERSILIAPNGRVCSIPMTSVVSTSRPSHRAA